MSDADLIDKVAELWDRGGGDVRGFWMSVLRIAEAIDSLQDVHCVVCGFPDMHTEKCDKCAGCVAK